MFHVELHPRTRLHRSSWSRKALSLAAAGLALLAAARGADAIASPGAAPAVCAHPPRPAAGQGTGWFRFDEAGRIFDPEGKLFVPVGVNANGPHAWWQDPTIGKSAAMSWWHFNTIRLTTCLEQGCNPDWNWDTNDDLDGIVKEYTSRKYVIMIANHQWGAGETDPAEHLPELTAWWRKVATRYKDNPYVWFNLANEPSWDLGPWLLINQTLAAAVREVAPSNVIVVDGSAVGQEKGNWTCDPAAPAGDWDTPPFANSGFVNYGPAFQRSYGPVVFSLHAYGQWGGNEEWGCGEADWDATFAAYLDKVRSLGLPLVIGEAGANPNKADEDWGHGGCWNATHMLFRTLPARADKIGLLFWHGADSAFNLFGDGQNSGAAWFDYDGVTPLNWEGQGMLDYAHLVNP